MRGLAVSPQASKILRDKFPGSNWQALKLLDKNFNISRDGVISRKSKAYNPTSREREAIQYLFLEWDYAYEYP